MRFSADEMRWKIIAFPNIQVNINKWFLKSRRKFLLNDVETHGFMVAYADKK